MILQKVEVENFRLLSKIEMQLEELATVVVGRNNSGKTSLYEVLRVFLDDRTKGFVIEDFSTACHCKFIAAAKEYTAGEGDEAVRNHLPAITLRLSFQYNPDSADFGALAPLIVDLDPKSDKAVVVLQYSLRNGRIAVFFADIPKTLENEADRSAFFRDLRERVPAHYAIDIWAEDPNDSSNTRALQPSDLSSLLDAGFINAQRGLDNEGHGETDVLGRVLEKLFLAAREPNAETKDRNLAESLESAIKDVSVVICFGTICSLS